MTAQQKKAIRQERTINRILIERDRNISFRDPVLGARRIEHAALLLELKDAEKKKKCSNGQNVSR